MGTKADLHANDWVIKFIAGGEILVYIQQGANAKDALDRFLEMLGDEEWFDLETQGGVTRVRTSFIGALEAYR